MLGCIEMLETGTTAVQDDCFFVPELEPDIIDAVMHAYADSGIRARLAIDQPVVPELDKLPFLADQLPPALKADLAQPPRVGHAEMTALNRQLVHCETGASLRLTMVAGRVVAEGGRVSGLDRAGLLAEATEGLGRKRRAVQDAARLMDDGLPFLRAMYLRTMETPVPMARRL